MISVKARMLILGGGLGALLGLFARPILPIFMYNPWVNSLIVLTFIFGLSFPFVFIYALENDMKFWKAYKAKESGLLANQRKNKLLRPFLINSTGGIQTHFSREDAELILSSVERKLSERHTVSRYVIGVLVLLGLLGTFVGLTQTVGAIARALKGITFDGSVSSEAFQSLKNSIQMPLSGMGVAFSSSIFGLIGSLILGVFDLQQGKAERDFYDDLERYFVSLEKKQPIAETSHGPAYVLTLLEHTAETLNGLKDRLVQMEDHYVRIAHIWQNVSDSMNATSAQGDFVRQHLQALLQAQENSVRVLQNMGASREKEAQAMLLALKRLLEDAMTGRQQITQDMRSEIRMIVKTLSLLSEPEDDFLAGSREEKIAQRS